MGWLRRAVERMEAASPPDCTHPHRTDLEYLIGGINYAVQRCDRCGNTRTVGLVGQKPRVPAPPKPAKRRPRSLGAAAAPEQPARVTSAAKRQARRDRVNSPLRQVVDTYAAAVTETPRLLREEIATWREHRSEQSRWAQAEGWADLCELSAQFCEGKLPETPDHDGPRMPETVRIAEPLAHANRQGFLTSGSQPGEDMIHDGLRFQQRAVVEGWALGRTLDQLEGLIGGTRLRMQATDKRPRRYNDYSQSFDATRAIYPDGSVHVGTEFGGVPSRRESVDLGRSDMTADTYWVTISDPEWGDHSLLWDRLSAPDWDNPPPLTDAERAPATTVDEPLRWERPTWRIRADMAVLIAAALGKGFAGRSNEAEIWRLDTLHAELHGVPPGASSAPRDPITDPTTQGSQRRTARYAAADRRTGRSTSPPPWSGRSPNVTELSGRLPRHRP